MMSHSSSRGRRAGAPILLAPTLLGLCGVTPALAQSGVVPGGVVTSGAYAAYRLAPGDDISVTFRDNPELNAAGPIGPDGRFTIPDIDSVSLADQTPDEAARHIALALREARIVADARPSVQVRQYAATVYVGGEVRQPGAVKLTGPLDPMQAVILAGGMLESARTNRVVVIRPASVPGAAPETQVVDIRDYTKHGRPLALAQLQARDVIFVPRSSIAEVNLWIEQHINRVLPFSRSLNYSLGPNLFSTSNNGR